MFVNFKLHRWDGLHVTPSVPRHVAHVARYLVSCLDGHEDEMPRPEDVHEWGTYTEALVELRLPLYRVVEAPELAAAQAELIIIGGRAGLEFASDSFGKWPVRPATLEDVCPGGVAWSALHETDDPSAFAEDPSPIPSSPKNCAIAYALKKLDDALTRQASLDYALSAAGVILGFASEAIGGSLNKSEAGEAAAAARWERDPSQMAKARACELWPRANREGWRASEMWRKLTDEGHSVAFTTVQKWMPRLRDGSLG